MLRFGAFVVVVGLVVGQPAGAVEQPRWKIVKRVGLKGDSRLDHVVMGPRNSGWAFGETGVELSDHLLSYRWDGRSWHYTPLPRGIGNLIGTAAVRSPKDAWVVTLKNPEDSAPNEASYYGATLLHWDGRKWKVTRRWPGTQFWQISAPAPDDVRVFGWEARKGDILPSVWHFDGRRWSRERHTLFTSRVATVSARDVWAVAEKYDYRTPTLRHFDGRRWKSVATPLPKSVQDKVYVDVSGLHATRTDVWVSAQITRGQKTETVLLHRRSGRWTTERPAVLQGQNLGTPVTGRSGLWVPVDSGSWPGYRAQIAHRSRTGTWTLTPITPDRLDGQDSAGVQYDQALAVTPGTDVLWRVGQTRTSAKSYSGVGAITRLR